MKKIKLKIKFKRGKINRNLRLGILIVLGLLIIISAYSALGAFQLPTTKEVTQTIPAVTYIQHGTYDLQFYLIPNTLFENITVLRPGEATIFKKLIDYTDASFTYMFQADEEATVQGTYKLEAEIQTNLWSKNYILIPETEFTGNLYTTFTKNFPLNISAYDEIVGQIEEETGVVVKDPILILKSTILTNAETKFGKIQELFLHSTQIPLGEEIHKFDENISAYQQGAIGTTKIITTQLDTSDQKATWIIATTLSFLIFIVVLAFTTSEVPLPTHADTIYRKIKKKYGEWIAEAETLPSTGEAKVISTKSFDDLIKISEEIGKPVIHYKTTTKNPGITHTFYVFDEDIHYKHVLSVEETIINTAKCPKCGEKVECEGAIGKTISIKCPSCKNKGRITLTKTSGINPFKRLFANKITSK